MASRFTNIVELVEAEDSPVRFISQALNGFNQFGLGIAIGITAFVTGSMAGFLWDRLLRPLESRALREQPARLFAEAQFRFQIALPLALLIVAIGFQESPWFLICLVVPALLVWHGQAQWRQAQEEPLKADLRGSELSIAYLRNANCTHVDFTGANLQLADLAKADVSSAQFQDAKLDSAILDDVNLYQISVGLTVNQLQQVRSLKGADLIGANLTRANLTGAKLYRAYFAGTGLTKMRLYKG